MKNINILYVCKNQYNTNTDIEYIKHYQLEQNPDSKINIFNSFDKDRKYDIIYLIDCILDNIVEEYIMYSKHLNKNGIIYVNNLTKTEYDRILDGLQKSNFSEFNLSYTKDKFNNYIILINKYYKQQQKINTQINKGEKTSHWIWYVFPTELEGRNEEEPKTKNDDITARLLINNIDWMYTHELIHDKIKKNIILFPQIDIGRIVYFIIFMKKIENNKMDVYLNDLYQYINKFYVKNTSTSDTEYKLKILN